MLQRPHPETIEILRRTLLEVEQKLDPITDVASIAELKRIVLQRIAELEIEPAPGHQIASRCDSSPLAAAGSDVGSAGSAPDLLPPTRAA